MGLIPWLVHQGWFEEYHRQQDELQRHRSVGGQGMSPVVHETNEWGIELVSDSGHLPGQAQQHHAAGDPSSGTPLAAPTGGNAPEDGVPAGLEYAFQPPPGPATAAAVCPETLPAASQTAAEVPREDLADLLEMLEQL